MSLLLTCLTPCLRAEERVEFDRDIRPILSDKCFQCHGPDSAAREAELRLDIADGKNNPFEDRNGSPVIKPGDLEASLLWYRLITADRDELMPPADSHKEPLTEAQRDLFKRWILQGAEYEGHWAFVPPKPRQNPDIDDVDWSYNQIDVFARARLEQLGLEPHPPADRRTLIRRVTFDLTGLPPTREEIDDFIHDPSPDAYERLVERLISTPSYGEHMARYWLDVVRFADTNGIHHDHYREMTPYRDWVIRAYNDNLRFDDFVVYQIAGDLFESPTLDQQIASGFNRLHLVIDRGTAIPQESFTRNVIDRVSSVGTAFMGLTVGCAVCHDHKYDPLTQRDFYQLFAFFNNIDASPETPGQGIHAPFLRLPSPEQSAELAAIEKEIALQTDRIHELKQRVQAVTEGDAGNAVSAPDASADADQEPDAKTDALALAEQALKQATQRKQTLEQAIPVSLVMKERDEIRPAHILIRGAYDQLGDVVERGTPDFLPPLQSSGVTKTRMDFAHWLTDQEHPLTARVTVNRIWQQFFGVGLVRTSEDFGLQGESPSHPELLDQLTIEFVNSNWDVKSLVKSIVCSQTYQQSSTADPSDFRNDPQNRFLARGSRFRMDAEMIRDQLLAVSGLLNTSMYGKSVKPPQPPNLWKSVSMVSSSTYAFEPDTGEKIFRRSLYSFWKRAMPPPQMTIFDAPTREACIARRERTNTPLQALVLMNEAQYFHAAQNAARLLLAQRHQSDDQRLRIAYEAVTSRLPDDAEMASLRGGLADIRALYTADQALTRELTGDELDMSDQARIELASYTMLFNSLFNLDVTKTRQ